MGRGGGVRRRRPHVPRARLGAVRPCSRRPGAGALPGLPLRPQRRAHCQGVRPEQYESRRRRQYVLLLALLCLHVVTCKNSVKKDDVCIWPATGTGSSSDGVSENSSERVSDNSIDSGSNGGSWAEMEEETAAFPDLSDFEFFEIILENSWDRLVRSTCLRSFLTLNSRSSAYFH